MASIIMSSPWKTVCQNGFKVRKDYQGQVRNPHFSNLHSKLRFVLLASIVMSSQ
jgi:hypothetical protein